MVTNTEKPKRPKAAAQPAVHVATTWISSDEAAERIGIKPKTLRNWRSTQRIDQPKFYKYSVQAGAVRYKLHEVDEWLESHGREF